MDKHELQDLLARYTSNSLATVERERLFSYYNELLSKNSLDDLDENLLQEKLKQIDLSKITALDKAPRPARWKYVAVAAASLLLFAFVGKILWHDAVQNKNATKATARILMVPDRAYALLPNGDSILLEGHGENLKERLGNKLTKAEKTQLITIRTPRAGRYNFVLPDGSKVWLNSASELRYPSTFDRVGREVQLEGEGYFEIAKLTRNNLRVPFRVQSRDQEVKVLGTKFNVSNYANELNCTTTLVEGSVRVINKTDNKQTLLKPDEQLKLAGSESILQKVDAAESIGWKDGVLVLDKMDFPEIARIIERNYDVNFVGFLPKGFKLNGELQTNVDLKELLKSLELYTNVRFNINGRNIMIKN
ncbi:FecR family protein [Sphingobacterium sp.]|uniref:FecR family protein n=1 Tax=Sphingobacterium sp. TaxID=341027 RepID=UPI002898AC91|nr:FecR family protein [Sphingobacterium sp.]